MIEAGKEFYTAYLAIQTELDSIKRNRMGRFKYADLDHIMESVRPLLSKHHMILVPQHKWCEGGSFLRTDLIHVPSGQGITSNVVLRAFDAPEYDDQMAGKNISYQRRYAVMTLLNITLEDDPSDDNGNAYQEKRGYRAPTSNDSSNGNTITPEQSKSIADALSGLGNSKWLQARIIEFNKVGSLEQLPQSKYQSVLKFIVDHGKES